MKVCSKCKETKFFDMFSKGKSNKDGLQSYCKTCDKAYREANKERYAEKNKAYREANKERVAEWDKAYREANRERYVEWNKVYYEANKERYAEKNKVYYEANKERVAENNKAYREANKERHAENNKVYREANKEKIAENKARRRAMKRNAIPKFLRNCELEKQRIRDTFKLRDLFTQATGIEHHVDHMWPLSKGGPHWSGNLQILTATENLSKGVSVCKVTKKNIKASLEIARKEYNNEDHSNGHRD